MKGSAKNYHLHLPSGKTELWKRTVLAPPRFFLSQHQPGSAPTGFGTDTSGVHGLGWLRTQCGEDGAWGQRSPSTCISAKGANRDPSRVPEQAGRGGQPPSEPLCKCQHLNRSRNTVSVEMLPRRTGSVSIQAGSKRPLPECSRGHQCHGKVQPHQ